MRRRLYCTLVAFLLVLLASTAYRLINPLAGNDLYFPFCGARALLAQQDPYAACPIVWLGVTYPQNPMTTILAVLPFAPLGPGIEFILWSAFSGLLVFGLLSRGEWWRLLIFTSAVWWVAFINLQWSPLLTAILYLPTLVPLGLIKPHAALPVMLVRMTWRRAVACVAFLLASLLVYPRWPLEWWAQASKTYNGFVPLLTPAGLLIGLALVRLSLGTTLRQTLNSGTWSEATRALRSAVRQVQAPGTREARAFFLLLMAAVPQAILYDPLPVWSVAASGRQMLALSLSSWLGYLIGLFFPSLLVPAAVVSVYGAALLLIFRARDDHEVEARQRQ